MLHQHRYVHPMNISFLDGRLEREFVAFIPDKDEVVGSTPISPTTGRTMKLFRRLLLVLSVASAIVGILRFGGSSKTKVTTKQGAWRSYTPPK